MTSHIAPQEVGDENVGIEKGAGPIVSCYTFPESSLLG